MGPLRSTTGSFVLVTRTNGTQHALTSPADGRIGIYAVRPDARCACVWPQGCSGAEKGHSSAWSGLIRPSHRNCLALRFLLILPLDRLRLRLVAWVARVPQCLFVSHVNPFQSGKLIVNGLGPTARSLRAPNWKQTPERRPPLAAV